MAFEVHPTPYRPRAPVAAMNDIAAGARAAKVEFPFSISRRQLSFQACIIREYGATSGCTASSRKVLNAGTKTLCIILAAVPMRSKPVSCFPIFCSSSIRKRRFRHSLCVAASSFAQIHSRRYQLVASINTSAMMFLASLSSIDIFLIR